jgi:hypothetical protein
VAQECSKLGVGWCGGIQHRIPHPGRQVVVVS